LVFLDDDLGANAANNVGVLLVVVEDAIVAVALKLLACTCNHGGISIAAATGAGRDASAYVRSWRGSEMMVASWLLSKHPCVVEYGERGEIYIYRRKGRVRVEGARLEWARYVGEFGGKV
jgi:hypothetical protein